MRQSANAETKWTTSTYFKRLSAIDPPTTSTTTTDLSSSDFLSEFLVLLLRVALLSILKPKSTSSEDCRIIREKKRSFIQVYKFKNNILFMFSYIIMCFHECWKAMAQILPRSPFRKLISFLSYTFCVAFFTFQG